MMITAITTEPIFINAVPLLKSSNVNKNIKKFDLIFLISNSFMIIF